MALKKVKERNALLYQPTILNYEKLIVSKILFAYCKVMTKQTLKSKTFVKVFLHFLIRAIPFYLVLLTS